MFKERKYTIAEMREITGTQDREGIRKRLKNYAIEFDESGWGKTVVFDIKNIPDKLKVFFVIDLKVPAQTDFTKLKYFLYYFFCDETFAQIPDEAKEEKLRGDGKDISRQTIAKYIERLGKLNLISKKLIILYITSQAEIIVKIQQKKHIQKRGKNIGKTKAKAILLPML